MSPSERLLQPLLEEEFEKLESFLVSDSTPEDCLPSLEMLDGYMTALVVGPEEIPTERWISCIWDQESDTEPGYASEAEAIEIRELLLRHMNTIALQFDTDADDFFPLFEQFVYADEEEKSVAVENWALGFTMGMELSQALWKPFLEDEESAQLVMPVFILAKITEDFDDLTEEDLSNLTLLMPEFVIKIYEYWNEA